MKFNKGETVFATNTKTQECFSFECPANGYCERMLLRYVVMRLGYPVAEYVFEKRSE